MEDAKTSQIECCVHTFCFECIKEWATKCANTCPLCKKRFHVIKYKDANGEAKEFPVTNRSQGMDDMGGLLFLIDDSEDFCYLCGSE